MFLAALALLVIDKFLFDVFSSSMVGLSFFVLAGEAGGGGGGSSENYGTVSDSVARASNAANRSLGYSVSSTRSGNTTSYSVSGWNGSDSISYSTEDESSTPFLTTWNGFRYEYENDFLFAKPQSAFSSYEKGIAAYQAGIGGDTYVLNNKLVVENGKLKFEIREIEPEESYIDTLSLSTVALKEGEHLVVDGNLKDFYAFDKAETETISNSRVDFIETTKGRAKSVTLAYDQLSNTSSEQGLTMAKDDELVVNIPNEKLETDKDIFILVDSHFRDWTLGEDSVPFSLLEKLSIQTSALGRRVATTAAGLVALAGFTHYDETNSSVMERISKVPHIVSQTIKSVTGVDIAYADHWGGGGGGYGGRSLVVAAQIGDELIHLETIFPRFAQASQEVVKIPKELIAKLTDNELLVRIRATKKHIVHAAFAFATKARVPEVKTLELTSAYHHREQKDYSKVLSSKDGNFLRTEPADVVTLTFTAPEQTANQKYLLTTNGFYTKMSADTKARLGNGWYHRLSTEDRRLLATFRKAK